jgi:hypothetical protein
VLRELARAPEHALVGSLLRERVLSPRLEEALVALERDGLLHREGDVLRLGPRPSGRSIGAATIGT